MNALLVCCADKLHNIRSIRWDKKKHGESVWHRFHGSIEEQKWYYEEMSKLFSERLNEYPGKEIAEELSKEVKRVFLNS